MKIRKNIIISVTAIIILGLYLMLNNTGKMNYKIPAFNSIDKNKISSIEIKGSGDPIYLQKVNEIWIFKSDNLRAEPSKVNEMVSFLDNPIFIDKVSDGGNYKNYGLDEGEYISITAKIEGDDNNLSDREILIGDLNSGRQFVFVRRLDNSGVFTVKENIKKLFEISKKDLLDKKILNFSSSEIDKIELIIDNKKTTLEKSVDSENKDTWQTSDGLSLDTIALNQSIRYLSNSRFDSYDTEGTSTGTTGIFKITLYAAENLSALTILKKSEEGYYSNSSYTEKDFILNENTGTQIIKMFSDMLN